MQLHLKQDAKPHYHRPRSVLYSLKQKVETELQRLQDCGVIEPVSFSEWAAPIVPVLKHDNTVRICGDYRLTVNQETTPDTYPLPRVEDLFATLSGGESFTKLDLAHAYLQMHLDEDSKKLTTVNTHKGLFQYNRLPFGVSSAPAVFQHTMENLFKNIPGVCVYLDDVLITGKTATEHLNNLSEVLAKMQSVGIRLNKKKCHFMLPEVEYLGHKITSRGLHPSEEKVRALKNAPKPTNVTQLKSFLGLVNYYSKFLPNLSTILAPLYKLLQKKLSWTWGSEQDKAFHAVKQQLSSSSVLTHYSPDLKLVLSCDASPYGVGAVLSHQFDDGSDQPIAFASRSLSPAEKKYAQIDKEGLAIVFGVTRFRQYLLGRHFLIYSDHKPLMHLFGETRGVPEMASARIQRWSLTLSAYSYSISYRPGKDISNADGLSRLPLSDVPEQVPQAAETILLLDCLQGSPISFNHISRWTARDPIMSKVLQYVLQGWPVTLKNESLLPYFRRKEELSVENNCLHSKWLEVHKVPSTSSLSAMNKLRDIFATHGLPEVMVSDNGPAFTSSEFDLFTKQNGIRHSKSSPYHPASNGLVERAVQTFKQSLKKSVNDGSLETRIARFLLAYRLTPHPSTGRAPAEMLMGRRPRSLLDLVRPDTSQRVQHAQEQNVRNHDQHSRQRAYSVGDTVLIRNGSKWLKGQVIGIRGPLSYTICLQDGRHVRRHVDHVQIYHELDDLPSPVPDPPTAPPAPAVPVASAPSTSEPADSNVTVDSAPTLRRSTRHRKPPDRYSPTS